MNENNPDTSNVPEKVLEQLLYKPGPSEQLRLSLTSDIIMQSIMPRPDITNPTEQRLHEFLGQAFVRWIDAEIKASHEERKEGTPASVVLHSGKLLDGIVGMTAAFMAYGVGVLIRPEDQPHVLGVMYDTSRKTTERALAHCEKVYQTVLAGVASQANEERPQ